MPNKILQLNQAHTLDMQSVGGKAYPLGLLVSKNINVPNGFVVLSSVFSDLKNSDGLGKKIDSLLRELRERGMNKTEEVSGRVRELVESAAVPKDVETAILETYDALNVEYVAVRSSSVSEDREQYSWAGEFETYTFVTRDDLIQQVVRCWSSLYTPRALMYAYKHNLPFASDMAVLVQQMIPSEAAGVCFTREPDGSDDDALLIEAIHGLGELLVHGDVTPDKYWVNKKENLILDVEVGNQKKIIASTLHNATIIDDVHGVQQKINGEVIVELSRTAVAIEKLMGKPQDIEWALFNNQLFILQSRPITSLND